MFSKCIVINFDKILTCFYYLGFTRNIPLNWFQWWVKSLHRTGNLTNIWLRASDNFQNRFDPLRVVFSTVFAVFVNVMKHFLSCLIYYSNCRLAFLCPFVFIAVWSTVPICTSDLSFLLLLLTTRVVRSLLP